MNRYLLPLTALALTAGATPAHDDPEALIARLDALQVVDVGALVVDYPEGSMNCYGPCEDRADDIAAAERDASANLASLVAKAEAIAAKPVPADATYDPDAVKRDLAALEALHVVTVERFVEAEPTQDAFAYGAIGEAERTRIEADNAARAYRLHALVAR
jgi:hypothetical protein